MIGNSMRTSTRTSYKHVRGPTIARYMQGAWNGFTRLKCVNNLTPGCSFKKSKSFNVGVDFTLSFVDA